MPELPEVETLRARLQKFITTEHMLENAQLMRENLRFPFPKKFITRITNTRITKFHRHGKYLLLHLDNQYIWLIHFGMSGYFRFTHGAENPVTKPAHSHAHFYFAGNKTVSYHDARRFGFMDVFADKDFHDNRFLKNLGPDPYHHPLDAGYLQQRGDKKQTSIKSFLMNQSIIAGLGNIYCSESLWLAQIHPAILSRQLTQRQWQKLSHAIGETVQKAVKAGGSSFSDFSHPDGALGVFQHQWQVYNRQGQLCPRCQKTPITRIVQNNRASFFCAHCTPAPT